MADFISLHPEEWVALISGLRFSAAISKASVMFIPVIILVLGLSLFIWLQRLEKDREWNAFILWLIFSSAIILSAFRTQKVVVELNPIVLNTKSMMLSIKQEEVKVDKERGSIYYDPEASGISALLAIPDKIASLLFNFMDANLLRKLTGQARTIPLDNMACKDPRYVAGLVQMLTLDWAFGLSMREPDKVEVWRERVQAFERCYYDGFKGSFPLSNTKVWVKVKLDGKAWGEAAGRGLITTLKASPLILLLLPVATKLAIIAGLAVFILGFSTKSADLIDEGMVNCGKFVEVFRDAAQNIVEKCDELLGVKRSKEEKEDFVKAVLVCLSNPDLISNEDAKKQCSSLREKTLAALETAKQAVDKDMYITKDSPVKNYLAGVVSEIKTWWFSTTYMDFPLKFDLLAKGQGIVLALLTGMFPFVAVLSVIPTGRHFMNWPLLLNFMIAYFLVKLWIPLLFFIVNVAGYNLARITGG